MAKKLEELDVSPAPWQVRDMIGEDGEVCGKWLVDGDGNDLITELDGDGVEGIAANARLIAAAPDLYECLREAIAQTCLCCLYEKCEECKVVNKWKAALAKASGEEMAK